METRRRGRGGDNLLMEHREKWCRPISVKDESRGKKNNLGLSGKSESEL